MKVSRALFLVLLTGCAAAPEPGDRLHVAVSVAPQAEIVRRIGGDRVTVESLSAPGASDEDLSLSPRKAMSLERADLYVKVGHPAYVVEATYVDPFLARHPKIRVVDMAQGVDVIHGDHGHEGGDPHVWVAPETVAVAARNIAAALSDLDPWHAAEYRSNLELFLKDLDRLDREIRSRLEGGQRAFLVYHPSWGYFARQYGLEQIAIEAEGKEPSAVRLIETIEHARREGARVLLVAQPRKSAQVLAGEIDGRIVTADPQSADWEGTLLRVADALGGRT